MQAEPPHQPERTVRALEEARRRQDLPGQQRVQPDGRARAPRAKWQHHGFRHVDHSVGCSSRPANWQVTSSLVRKQVNSVSRSAGRTDTNAAYARHLRDLFLPK